MTKIIWLLLPKTVPKIALYILFPDKLENVFSLQMWSAFRIKIVASIFSSLFVLLVHSVNYWYTGEMIHTTADDPSYIRPAENWIETGTWKENFEGASAYMQRPPLMGIQHGIFYFISPEYADILTFALAIVLHGIAVYLLSGFLLSRFSKRIAMSGIATYIFMPIFWGFLSYRISETFTVQLVTISICLLFSKRASIWTWLIIMLCVWLFRPVLLLLFLPVAFSLVRKRKTKLSITQLMFFSVLFASTLFWEIRKEHYLGSWLAPHPIYSADNQTMFRPAHFYLTELFRIWEVTPENFHRISGSLWIGDTAILDQNELKRYIVESKCPLNEKKLKTVLRFYQNASLSARLSFGKTTGETAIEKRFDHFCKNLTDNEIKNNRFQYYLLTPIRSARSMFTKSQLNLELFQSEWRGNPLVEILRYCCLLFILVGIPVIFLSILIRNPFRLLAVGGALYLFYLFWFQRLNEDRYMIAILPVLLVLTTSLANRLPRKPVSGE